MKRLRLKKLTRARMEQWLRENSNKQFKRASAGACPIACYLKDSYPDVERALINGRGCHNEIMRKHSTEYMHLPAWACALVELVDRGHSVHRLETITAPQTLELLQSI